MLLSPLSFNHIPIDEHHTNTNIQSNYCQNRIQACVMEWNYNSSWVSVMYLVSWPSWSNVNFSNLLNTRNTMYRRYCSTVGHLTRYYHTVNTLYQTNPSYWYNCCHMNAIEYLEGERLTNHDTPIINLWIAMPLHRCEARLVVASRLQLYLIGCGISWPTNDQFQLHHE